MRIALMVDSKAGALAWLQIVLKSSGYKLVIIRNEFKKIILVWTGHSLTEFFTYNREPFIHSHSQMVIPIPTRLGHVTLIYGLIPPMAGRNRVKAYFVCQIGPIFFCHKMRKSRFIKNIFCFLEYLKARKIVLRFSTFRGTYSP